MEIYSSARTKAKSDQPVSFYYSRTKLIVGAVIWTLSTAFFGALTYRSIGQTGAMAFCGFITATSIWMFFNCIKPLGSLDTPVLTIGRDGILFPDGVLIAWDDMKENTYVDQSYMGIPIAKAVVVKTTLKKPKVKQLRVAALQMSSDEYLAECDRYSQAA